MTKEEQIKFYEKAVAWTVRKERTLVAEHDAHLMASPTLGDGHFQGIRKVTKLQEDLTELVGYRKFLEERLKEFSA